MRWARLLVFFAALLSAACTETRDNDRLFEPVLGEDEQPQTKIFFEGMNYCTRPENTGDPNCWENAYEQ